MRQIAARLFWLLCVCTLAAPASFAQGSSTKPITLIVPFVPGSPTDQVARVFASEFGNTLGTAVIVENKPGASQTIAGAYVARAIPDGNTLFFVNIPAVVAPSVQATLPYSGIRDFAPISDILKISFMLVTAPNIPAKNLSEFIAMLKADPGKYSFGSSGISTTIHLVAEMFNYAIGVKTLHVPYKGGNQVQMDLVSDRITYAFLPTGSMDFVHQGKLKGFGFASDKRDPAYPELPTMEEAGMPGFQAAVDFVLVGPPKTPPARVAQLNSAANKVISNAAFYDKIKSLGGVTISNPATPAQVGAYIASEETRWNDLVRKAHIKLE